MFLGPLFIGLAGWDEGDNEVSPYRWSSICTGVVSFSAVSLTRTLVLLERPIRSGTFSTFDYSIVPYTYFVPSVDLSGHSYTYLLVSTE